MNLANIRKSKKVSQQKLADYLNVSRSTVSMWEINASEPDSENLKRIADYFNTTIDEIMGYTPGKKSNAGVRIPILGNTAAGIPIQAIEEFDSTDPDDWEEITSDMANLGQYFALRIKGDSMEPKISDGDVVIIRIQPDADTGDTVIVKVNGDEVTCKKIKKTEQGIFLISSNPAYEPMFYSNEEIAELPLEIIGKVVELRAKF